MTKPTAAVHINEHIVELPEAEARTLFLAAVAMSKRTGALAITTDVMVAITPATRISLTIPDGFHSEYDPAAVVELMTRTRSHGRGAFFL